MQAILNTWYEIVWYFIKFKSLWSFVWIRPRLINSQSLEEPQVWAQLTNPRDQPSCRPTWLPLCWPPCLTKNNFCRLPCATTCQPRTKIKTKKLSAAMSAIMRRKYGFGLIGGLGVSVAPRVETPGDKILDQILSGYVVSRPLRPKWAVPHPIITQNMKFYNRKQFVKYPFSLIPGPKIPFTKKGREI